MDTRADLWSGGQSVQEVRSALRRLRSADVDFRNGRSFGLTYWATQEIDALIADVAQDFAVENAFSIRAMPSIGELQRDIVNATIELLNGGEEATGTMTSGGTESIMLAVKCAQAASRLSKLVVGGSVVGPVTAHPAFKKACDLYGLNWRSVPVGPDLRVSPMEYGAALTDDTVLAVASAPSFPWGMVDPIPELAALAQERGVLFHVDACIGGFLLPFAELLGRRLPTWDFRVPGVTSISADLHKFGYGMRGASLLLHATAATRVHQRFTHSAWPGGHYSTQGIVGSRPAAPIAAGWAVMRFLGRQGYCNLTRRALAATDALTAEVLTIPGVYIVGEPDASVLAIGSHCHDMIAVGAALRELGWHVETQESPTAIHLMVSAGHDNIIEAFVSDFHQSLDTPPALRSLAIYGDGGLVSE